MVSNLHFCAISVRAGSSDMSLDARRSKGEHLFSLAAGTLLHEFEVQFVLGYGGFGITYLALDTNLQEQVAIKEYLPNDIGVRISDETVQAKSDGDRRPFEAGLESFLEEARRLVRARHPNVVNVRRFFRLHGTGYIVQNYERGQTLGQRLDSGPIPEGELRRILNGVLDGLEKVHDLPMLHRDIKPSNIILREDGIPVLIDFGAARDFENRNSRSITAMGTEGYSPPEQRGVGGQQGPWTDLYALGATAYHCITGEPPADALRRLRKDVLVPAQRAAEGKYSHALLGAIDWMLKIDEVERPVSVAALREALQSGGIPGRAPQSSISSVTMKPGAGGTTLLEFDRPIAADVLELAFHLTSSGDYLAPSGQVPQWSKAAHYFVLNRSNGSSNNLFEVTSDIGQHLPSGAEVTISSHDGYIKTSGSWPVLQLTAPSPKKSGVFVKVAAVAVTLLLLGGAYGAFTYYQDQAAQKQQAAEQKLTQDLAHADITQSTLEVHLAACGEKCQSELKSKAMARIEQIKQHAQAAERKRQEEEADRLEQEKKQQAAEQKLMQDVWNPGITQSTLEADLVVCDDKCSNELTIKAQNKIKEIKQQRDVVWKQQEERTFKMKDDAAFENARGRIDKLRAYIANCNSRCEHSRDAVDQIVQLTDAEARKANEQQRQGAIESDQRSIERLAHSALIEFYSRHSSDVAASDTYLRDLYAPLVTWYGEQTRLTPQEIVQKKQTEVFEKWPERHFSILEDTLQYSCDAPNWSCTVSGQIQIKFGHSAGVTDRVGSAYFSVGFNNLNSNPKVTSEWSRSIR